MHTPFRCKHGLITLRRLAGLIGLASLFALTGLSGCGGGGASTDQVASPMAASDVVAADELVTIKVGDFPHDVDVYKTARATRAIVLLHGGGGNKSAIAFQVGLNSSASVTTVDTIKWTWLDTNKVMLIVPQGQHVPGADDATTWRNYAMDSGQDDKAFLQALAAKIRTDYGIQDITLMGHSMGGVMTNRMWCESPTTFNNYVSLAGPASTTFNRAATPCAPTTIRPYMGIIGDNDPIMQTTGAWEASIWRISKDVVDMSSDAWVNPFVIGEFHQQQARAALACNETLGSLDYVREGNVDTWLSCSATLKLKRVRDAGHGVDSLDEGMGTASKLDIMNAVLAFSAR